MKKVALFLSAAVLAGTLNAQDLPKPSPLGKTEQVVGVTKVSVEYSRPSVKGRRVFGELVAYDQVWRLGANSCTKFTCSSDLYFEGGTLPAGSYAMFAYPSVNEWAVVFNSDLEQSGTSNYNAEKNVVKVAGKVQENSFNETLVIEFNNVTSDAAVISIKWDKLRVDIPFKVDTDKLAKQNIEAAIEKGTDLDVVYYRAANYYFSSLNDNKTAMEYLNKSLALKEGYANLFLKGQILFAEGKTKEAIEAGEKAHKLAVEAGAKGFAEFMASTIEEWKAKK